MSGVFGVVSRGDSRVLILKRPDLGNCLSQELVEGLHGALDEAENDHVRLLTLRGEGRNFCTGFDLTDIDGMNDGGLLHRFVRIEQLLWRFHSAPFMTLAQVQGRATGAGADLVVACARRIAAPGARFSFPGAGFGVVLGAGRLAACIGSGAAQTLVASGAEVDASASLALGLVNAVVPVEGFEADLDEGSKHARRLDWETLATLRSALVEPQRGDSDLAALTRSAARPGLALRMQEYRGRALAAKPRPWLQTNAAPAGEADKINQSKEKTP